MTWSIAPRSISQSRKNYPTDSPHALNPSKYPPKSPTSSQIHILSILGFDSQDPLTLLRGLPKSSSFFEGLAPLISRSCAAPASLSQRNTAYQIHYCFWCDNIRFGRAANRNQATFPRAVLDSDFVAFRSTSCLSTSPRRRRLSSRDGVRSRHLNVR